MIIDCHAHLIPPALIARLGAGQEFPYIDVIRHEYGLTFRFPGLPESPLAPKAIAEPAAFVAWQREQGIDVQVVAPWTDLLGYTLPTRSGVLWCTAMNEALAEVAVTHPSLWAIGGVPLQDPEAAAEHLRFVSDLGMRGVMIGTGTPDRFLDDPGFDVFWSAAAELALPVFIHPIFLRATAELAGQGLANAIGRANATHVALARILLAGVVLRHPGLSLVVSHGGAGLPYLLARLERSHQLDPATTSSPRQGFGRLLFDSVVLDPTALSTLFRFVEPDQVLLGSDYPFPWEPQPLAAVRRAGLDPAIVAAVISGNPGRVFGARTAKEPRRPRYVKRAPLGMYRILR